MKAHFEKEPHFENESMFLEKWKVINPFLGLFVLDSTIDGTKVLLENSDKSEEQMWYRSVSNSKGYFTLKNPMTGKFLTASRCEIFGFFPPLVPSKREKNILVLISL